MFFLSGVLLTSIIEKISITFTSNGKREFVPRDQVFQQQQHILYLNTIGFKAQSLWGRVKVITNEYTTILKLEIRFRKDLAKLTRSAVRINSKKPKGKKTMKEKIMEDATSGFESTSRLPPASINVEN